MKGRPSIEKIKRNEKRDISVKQRKNYNIENKNTIIINKNKATSIENKKTQNKYNPKSVDTKTKAKIDKNDKNDKTKEKDNLITISPDFKIKQVKIKYKDKYKKKK